MGSETGIMLIKHLVDFNYQYPFFKIISYIYVLNSLLADTVYFNIVVFEMEVNAESGCDFVEFVMDTKTFTNGSTLYKPNNTDGVVRCSRCDRKSPHDVVWFTSNGPPGNEISTCDDNDMLVPCTRSVANSKIDLDLVFSTFVTETYKCGGYSRQSTINIKLYGWYICMYTIYVQHCCL